MRLLLLATRNLLRNTRRTVLTLAAIAVGLGFMLYAVTLTRGIITASLDAGTRSLAGDVVIQAQGYQEQRKPALVVEGVDAMTAALHAEVPDAIVAPRIFTGGLLSSATSSARLALVGLDPEAEREVQDLDDKVIEGTWLEQDDREIVIGAGMARVLKVGIGDKVVYTGQHGSSEVLSRLFRVKGIFRTGAAELDGRMAYAHLGAAQELLGGGDVANMVTLHLDDPDQADAITARVHSLVGRPELDVRSWRDALPDLLALLQFTIVSTDIMMAVLGIIVAFGVLNTMLMSTLERTREFGLMKALGLRPRHLAAVVLLEGIVLGLAGTMAGLLVGLLVSWPLVEYGFDYGAMGMGESIETGGVVVDSLIMGVWDPGRTAAYCLVAVGLCVIATAYPAWSISRLRPVDALRHH